MKQLSNLGGKFKLIWFTDLCAIYAKDTVLNFLRSFVAAYLLQSQWAADVEHFVNPTDLLWLSYLHELMPSFLVRNNFFLVLYTQKLKDKLDYTLAVTM